MTIHGLSDFRKGFPSRSTGVLTFRRGFPKGSSVILSFRRSGDRRRSEFQDGPERFLLAEPGEAFFVGVDGDAGAEAEIGGGEFADHEPEVVVEVIVLTAESEDDAQVVHVGFSSFGIAGDEGIDGDGDAVPVAEAADAVAQVGGEAVVLDGAKRGLLGSIMSGPGVAELSADEGGDGFGLELEAELHAGVHDDSAVELVDHLKEGLPRHGGKALRSHLFCVFGDGILRHGLAAKDGDEGAAAVIDLNELGHGLSVLQLHHALQLGVIGDEGVQLSVPEGTHHAAMHGGVLRFLKQAFEGIARLRFGPPLWGKLSVHGWSLSKGVPLEKNFFANV